MKLRTCLLYTSIMAECCHPIPGDDVLGYVDENDRIIIHKRQCPVAAKLKSSYGTVSYTHLDVYKRQPLSLLSP